MTAMSTAAAHPDPMHLQDEEESAATEHTVIRALHPTWLTMWLPNDVANLLCYDPEEVRGLRDPGRGIAFLARGPRVVRVVSSFRAQEFLGVETRNDRLIAFARVTENKGFSVPVAVVRYLGLRVARRGLNGGLGTDDAVMWFLPSSEYREYQSSRREGRSWTTSVVGGFAHVYLARSTLPLPSGMGAIEEAIETSQWRSMVGTIPPQTPSRPLADPTG